MKKSLKSSMLLNVIWMIIGLTLQYFLGMATNLFVEFPKGENAGQLWLFAFHQVPLALHIILGTLLLIGSIVLIIRAFIARDHTWITVSIVGFIGILVSAYGGENFITTQTNQYSFIMATGFIAALLTYVFGVYEKAIKLKVVTRK